jgi:S-adenosyl-L-methionine hydrolase (adenosine-forming)
MTIVTLLTDFGLRDTYVGAMKGVILGKNPGVEIVDLTHEVGPQDVLGAAYLLDTAWRFFPKGTIHVVVVDPEVGTGRRRLALECEGHYFVGPDNGCLSAAIPAAVRGRREAGDAYEARRVRLLRPSVSERTRVRMRHVRAVLVENQDLFLQPVSATFEGRDVFAPVAAFLSAGGEVEALGRPVFEVEALPELRAVSRGAALHGLVIHVDRFGNLTTDLRPEDLSPRPVFEVGGRRIEGLSRTYAESADLAAIVGSAGYVEIAIQGGSAARESGARVGDRVLALSEA